MDEDEIVEGVMSAFLELTRKQQVNVIAYLDKVRDDLKGNVGDVMLQEETSSRADISHSSNDFILEDCPTLTAQANVPPNSGVTRICITRCGTPARHPM